MNKKVKRNDMEPIAVVQKKHPKLSQVRIRQLCQTRKIIAEKLTSRLWLVSEKSLKEYLASDRKPGPKSTTS